MCLGAKQAFAVQDVNDVPSLFSAPNGQIMYALVAIQAIALIGAAVGGNNLILSSSSLVSHFARTKC